MILLNIVRYVWTALWKGAVLLFFGLLLLGMLATAGIR